METTTPHPQNDLSNFAKTLTDMVRAGSVLSERRILAYVDILGFSDAVSKWSEKELQHVLKLLKALDAFAAKETEINDPQKRNHPVLTKREHREFTSFSDCVVISDSEFGHYSVLELVGAMLVELLNVGFACRGGVVIGNAHHEGRIVFGEAHVEAVRLEKEVACYPRVIVEEAVVRGFQSCIQQNVKEFGISPENSALLKRGDDGCWFIDIFAAQYLPRFLGSNEHVQPFLRKLKLLLEKNCILNKSCDLKIVSKWRWLANEFNTSVRLTYAGMIEPVVF